MVQFLLYVSSDTLGTHFVLNTFAANSAGQNHQYSHVLATA